MEYNTYDLGKIINNFQNAYTKLNITDIPEYTTHLIKTLKTRNTPLLDTKVIVAAVVTKKPEHLETIMKDSGCNDIYKFIEEIYEGGI